jgi:hypothetical protein
MCVHSFDLAYVLAKFPYLGLLGPSFCKCICIIYFCIISEFLRYWISSKRFTNFIHSRDNFKDGNLFQNVETLPNLNSP